MHSEEIALSSYLPMFILLIILEIIASAYRSVENSSLRKQAAASLFLNLSWTCVLFPLLLDRALFSYMIVSLYQNSERTIPPLNENGLNLLATILVMLLIIINTIDVFQSFKTAEESSTKSN